MSDETVAMMWREYSPRVLPEDCSDIQRRETERAFYAGAFSILNDHRAGILGKAPPEKLAERIRKLYMEARDWHIARLREDAGQSEESTK